MYLPVCTTPAYQWHIKESTGYFILKYTAYEKSEIDIKPFRWGPDTNPVEINETSILAVYITLVYSYMSLTWAKPNAEISHL